MAVTALLVRIHMFFEERDAVAIHTLVGAASLLLSDLVQDKFPDKSWDSKAQIDNTLSPQSFYKIMRKMFIVFAQSIC